MWKDFMISFVLGEDVSSLLWIFFFKLKFYEIYVFRFLYSVDLVCINYFFIMFIKLK